MTSRTFWTITLSVEVNDPRALWDAARALLHKESPGATPEMLGFRSDPDVGACLQMLLDRSENLAGAEIEESSSQPA